MKPVALALAVLFAAPALPALADPIVTLTFAGLRDNEPINDFYNGGTGGQGSTGGVNYGISFSSDSLASISQDNGGTGRFSDVPPPATGNTAAFFLNGAGDTMNVAAGFDTGFAFFYASPYYSGSVKVFSGQNGTGTLLASDLLAKTAAFCDPSFNYSCWVNTGVGFNGTAESVVFSGVANYVGFADITTGATLVPTAGDVPEPAAITLVASGVCFLAGVRRRLAPASRQSAQESGPRPRIKGTSDSF